MYCKECGTKLDDDSKYCDVCGKKVTKNTKNEIMINRKQKVIYIICLIVLIIYLAIIYTIII